MVDQMVAQLHLDPSSGRPGPGDGWQAYLQWLAHGVRQLVQEHPHAFPLIATRHPAAPWLRPPLRSLEVVEDFLSTLVARGFTDDGAVAAYRAFSSFLLGHLLLEVSTLGADVGPLDVIDDGEDRNAKPMVYPTVQRLRRYLAEDHSAVEFEEALEELLNRIALMQSQS
jgi:TetR/AcrR family transcriptional regulator, tetracycline repressor protein